MKKLLAFLAFALLASTWGAPARAQVRTWPEYSLGARTHITNIRTLQRLLNVRGYRVAVDSVFGKQTESALKRFQKARGLRPTGTATGATWDALIVRIRRGSRGQAVRALQEMLSLAGFKTGQDGVFGSGTERALRRFQKEFNLVADGVAGPQTWSALMMEVAMRYE